MYESRTNKFPLKKDMHRLAKCQSYWLTYSIMIMTLSGLIHWVFWQRSSPLQGETASWKVMRERVNDIVLNSYAVVAVWEVILKYCFNSVPQGWPIHLMKYVANNYLFWIWLANQADNCVLRDIELSAKIHLLSFI